jgi:hypothetical protein
MKVIAIFVAVLLIWWLLSIKTIIIVGLITWVVLKIKR